MSESAIHLVDEKPSVAEFRMLREQSGLSGKTEAAAIAGLAGGLFAVTLRDDDKAIGMGRIIGDGGCFFQVTDIAILPGHQGRGLAKWIMQALADFVATLPKTAYVSLIADVPANRLYSQFGFDETAPRSVGMARRVL